MSDAPLDAVVVGGGPAGLAAGLWLGRYRRRTAVLDSGRYRNEHVERVHGYLGCDPTDPEDLRKRARHELAAYPGVEVLELEATAARAHGGGFVVEAGERRLESRRVVLATGVRDVYPEVDGFFEHYGADVFHCPTCDGYEARDCHVVVFGWSPDIAGFALGLLEWAADVCVVTEGRPFEGDGQRRAELAAAGVEVLEDDAVALVGRRGDLRAVELRSGRRLAATQVFFSIAHRPVTGLAEQLGCRLTEEGCVEVDGEGRTSVEGVCAAGDLTPGIQLVQVAAAKGTVAGITCARSL